MRSPDRQLLKSLMIMGAVVEARDHFTGGHLWRVSQMGKLLAQRAGLPDEKILAATVGGWLHDLGKVGVPDALLLKPGRLDADEWEVMRQHPVIGRSILADHPLADLAVDVVAHHHERWDGKGYPDALTGSDIPVLARVVAIADAFEALTSVRPYRQRPLTPKLALEKVRAERARQFDPVMTDSFVEIVEGGLLDDVVGYCDFHRPLVLCPHCGPVIALPRTARAGDVHECLSCAGEYVLETAGESFKAVPTGRRAAVGRPRAPDRAQIEDVLSRV